MSDNQTSSMTISRSLFIFSIFYGGMVCIAGVLGNKQVSLGPLAVEAGIFPFLLLVILSSTIAALHGKEVADKLVKYGFLPLIGSIVLTALVYAIPASPKMDPKYLDAFNTMMGQTPRIWIAGIVAYGTSQLLTSIFSTGLRRASANMSDCAGALPPCCRKLSTRCCS